MTTDLSDATLKKLAGAQAYERGLDYFRSDRVIHCQQKGQKIKGIVQGAELYEVELQLGKNGLDGHCDCPASENIDFCKHCVALAMHYRSLNKKLQPLESDNSLQRIQAFLEQQDKPQLIQYLLSIFEADADLQGIWSIKVDVALGKIDIKGLKKRITSALPINRHLHSYAQARAYFERVEPVVDLLAQQFDVIPPEQALVLVEYSLDRMQKALQTVDDSGGFRLTAEDRLQQLHVRALSRVPWDKARLAQYLFALKEHCVRDLYPEIPGRYADALGQEGMNHYYTIVRQAWDALPPLTADVDWEQRYAHLRLSSFLLEWAEARHDFPDALAIKLKTATEQIDFIRIAEYCIQHNEWEQAKLWLARAAKLRQEPDGGHPKLNLERLQLVIRLHDQEYEKAMTLQWKIFSQSVQLADYLALLKLEQKVGKQRTQADRARVFLRDQMKSSANEFFRRRSVNSLLEICLHEKDLAAALALVQAEPVHPPLLHQLAQAFAHQPVIAMTLYQRLAVFWVGEGKNDTYKRAVALLQECEQTLRVPAHQAAFQRLLQDMQTQFKSKRNFIQFLKAAFAKELGR